MLWPRGTHSTSQMRPNSVRGFSAQPTAAAKHLKHFSHTQLCSFQPLAPQNQRPQCAALGIKMNTISSITPTRSEFEKNYVPFLHYT